MNSIGRLLAITGVCFGLTACAANILEAVPASSVTPVPAKVPPTTLIGNWFITGSRVPATYPTFSTSLYVQGNVVQGLFTAITQCTNSGVPSTISTSGLALNGTIADDGTFQATSGTIGGGTLPTIAVSLTGNSPSSAAPYTWTGTYSIATTGSAAPSCNTVQTANFSASPIAPLTGSYAGVPINTPSPFGPGAVVSVQIAQGLPTLVTRARAQVYEIPLTATLTISNSPCALTISTTGLPELSLLSGDSFEIFFPEPQLPFAVLSGTLNDISAKSFFGDLTGLAANVGCSGIAFYTFTRQ